MLVHLFLNSGKDFNSLIVLDLGKNILFLGQPCKLCCELAGKCPMVVSDRKSVV